MDALHFKEKSRLCVILTVPRRGHRQRNLVVHTYPQEVCTHKDISVGFLAGTKCISFDVHFWVNAHQHPPGPLSSCRSQGTTSDGRTHLKITPES